MFRTVSIEDIVRIPPERFGEELERIAYDQLREKYLGRVDPDLGLIVAISKVEVEDVGAIIPGDGATYHKATVDLLTYFPVMHEVIEGEIVDVKKIGIFVNVGPVDAFAHISQITDDRLRYDELRGQLQGEETKVTYARGDVVRGRVVNVSLAPPTHIRVGMTLKQPGMGKIREGVR